MPRQPLSLPGLTLLAAMLIWHVHDCDFGPPQRCENECLSSPSANRSSRRLVAALTGATGFQGRDAVRCLLDTESRCFKQLQSQREYPRQQVSVRAVTRNANSSAARELSRLGVEMVQGSYYDADTALRLVQDVEDMLLVTFSDFEQELEVKAGRSLLDAAYKAGVQRLVMSSGPNTSLDLINAKAKIEAYARQLSFPQAYFVHTGFFFENFVVKGGQPRLVCSWEKRLPDSDNADQSEQVRDIDSLTQLRVTLSAPFPASFPLTMHAASDVGRAAAAIFSGAFQPATDTLRLVGERLSGAAFAQTVTRVCKISADYKEIPPRVLEEMIGGETGRNIRRMVEWVLSGGYDEFDTDEQLQIARQSMPLARTVEQWLRDEGCQLILQVCRQNM